MDLYTKNALQTSELTTNNYSTSFSLGVRSLHKNYRMPVYAIYGFVRFADEIVDTFHGHDQRQLLQNFEDETFEAIRTGISTNPILQSFQWVVNTYRINHGHIRAFFHSMAMDLENKQYDRDKFQEYVYGSAEVVGLMCLRVFYANEDETYERLIHPARKLGEAFQKINFLRDLQADYEERGRLYFPHTNWDNFDDPTKASIEEEIQQDFDEAYQGIVQLKQEVRMGVYLAYKYYTRLFAKIRRTKAENILQKRYRIPNVIKAQIFARSYLRNRIGFF